MSNKRRSSNSVNTSTKQYQITKFVEKNGDLAKGNTKVTKYTKCIEGTGY